ncbi:MAG: hypothetical protein IT324_30725 [Anaerolineae bacterium]|nr:hypothetical protein [Anaerolineae bacterium]
MMNIVTVFLLVFPLLVVFQGLVIIASKRGGIDGGEPGGQPAIFELQGKNAKRIGIVYVLAGLAMLITGLLFSLSLVADGWVWVVWIIAWFVLALAYVLVIAYG